eukprot:3552712-Lingulodinium_polyedra.AAC.1
MVRPAHQDTAVTQNNAAMIGDHTVVSSLVFYEFGRAVSMPNEERGTFHPHLHRPPKKNKLRDNKMRCTSRAPF